MGEKKLGFGFMRLPLLPGGDQKKIDLAAVNRLVDAFIERGFSYFDTALTYHGGESEAAIRACVVERHPRHAFTIATKLPPRVLKNSAEQEDIFAGQLERCGVDAFDYYLVHNIGVPSWKQALEFGTFEFALEKKRQGRIREVGMSFHDTPQLLEKALSTYPELDFVQLQINYFDWDNPGIQARQCYEVARAHGKPIVVMEPCKGGNLAILPEEAAAPLRACRPDASFASWAMRFAAGQEGVRMVLSGMNDMAQLEDNMATLDGPRPLDATEEQALAQARVALEQNAAIGCTGCRYCLNVCPENIPIPDYFALYNNYRRALTKNFSSQFVYYHNLAAAAPAPEACRHCGRCARICPQHLAVPALLEEVAATFNEMRLPSQR